MSTLRQDMDRAREAWLDLWYAILDTLPIGWLLDRIDDRRWWRDLKRRARRDR